MRRREFISLVGSTLTWPLAARAQRTEKLYRIAFFSAGSLASVPITRNAFVKTLHQLGWTDGKNVAIEYRFAENKLDELPAMAAELVRLNVDVIVAAGTLAPLAAKRATTTIPIVMTSAGDPLSSGLVASLRYPGGNVTGVSIMAPDLEGKRLELLKELVPRISNIAVLWNGANPYPAQAFRDTTSAARRLGIDVQSLEVKEPNDFEKVFELARLQQPDALLVIGDPLVNTYQPQIVNFAAKSRLPAIYQIRQFAEAGGLISYGPSLVASFQRAAEIVDKVLRGTAPAAIPVEQPTKFELIINMKTAKMLGLSVPETLIARADEIIE